MEIIWKGAGRTLTKGLLFDLPAGGILKHEHARASQRLAVLAVLPLYHPDLLLLAVVAATAALLQHTGAQRDCSRELGRERAQVVVGVCVWKPASQVADGLCGAWRSRGCQFKLLIVISTTAAFQAATLGGRG